MDQPLWTPSEDIIRAANITRFMEMVRERHGVDVHDYPSLHRWSIEDLEGFWGAVWDFCGVIASARGERVLVDRERMPGARWFPDARLNYARNLLRRRDEGEAIVFWGEAHGGEGTGDGGRPSRRLTFAQLHDQVSRVAAALRAAGIRPGDRVAGYLPNLPETIIAMLGAASVGAVWSSCSPDFGAQGVVDRFGQIEPRALFAVDGYTWNGARIDVRERVGEVLERIPSIERTVVVPYLNRAPELRGLREACTWDEFVLPHPAGEIEFEELPFDHPLFIMYSSGTTGAPKCIVHGAGGTLLQHLKEHQLHVDLKPDDRIFYFTTCGWMMWNWLASALASNASLALYEGSPFHPDARVLFDFADAAGFDVFGTSAKYLDAVKKAGLHPRETHSLGSVQTILSTGSPLAPETFDFVYEHIRPDVRLSSITGGTDIIGCFAQGCPILPVWRGELQCIALGMKVEVFDDEGRPVQGEKGELVCTAPFPSMPIGFWNDPDGSRYRAAYFERFPGVWCHGDYVETTEHGGLIVHGRSDAVLNPGGVRIGTAEIYRQVEQLDEIVESLVVGQEWDNDVRVVLFVVLRPGLELDDALIERIRTHIRRNATPRHVPARIVQVPDIPRTRSGKIVELAVRDVIHGRPIKNKEALANPEALEHFVDRPELAT